MRIEQDETKNKSYRELVLEDSKSGILFFKKGNVIANNVVSDKCRQLALVASKHLGESTLRLMVKDVSAVSVVSITHNNAMNA